MKEPEFHLRAQTNLQLYRQLLAVGFGSKEVTDARDAYTVATKLFAGLFRPDGRPFLCHVVGVASILAMVEAPIATVIAGLLHSAYSHGDFGRGRGQVTPAARDRLRAAIGPETESLLACYSSQTWNSAAVARLRANVTALENDVRQVVVIRLADSLEDALDHALQLSQKESNPHRDIRRDCLVDLANAMGYPTLGASLDRLLAAEKPGPDLTALQDHHSGSYLLCPPSWREKLSPRIARFVRRVRAGY